MAKQFICNLIKTLCKLVEIVKICKSDEMFWLQFDQSTSWECLVFFFFSLWFFFSVSPTTQLPPAEKHPWQIASPDFWENYSKMSHSPPPLTSHYELLKFSQTTIFGHAESHSSPCSYILYVLIIHQLSLLCFSLSFKSL